MEKYRGALHLSLSDLEKYGDIEDLWDLAGDEADIDVAGEPLDG